MNRLTPQTRRDVFDIFSINNIRWNGILEEPDFLLRLYSLHDMESTDSRFEDAYLDIWQHRVNNDDWDVNWVFTDDSYNLKGGDDSFLLKFLCETIHPVVRRDQSETKLLLVDYNKLLASDGYEIFEDRQISGQPAFGFRDISRTTIKISSMPQSFKPIQKILFGSPGTGKSYQIRGIAKDKLGIPFDENSKMLGNTVKTVFHPEYTYSDFMGKLLPLTQGDSVIYKFYPGHFLRVLGMAYQALAEERQENFLLVIDELNRGNAAAIFGTVFQLLDRESDGWSSYEVDISEMELVGLLGAMQINVAIIGNKIKITERDHTDMTLRKFCENRLKELIGNNPHGDRVYNLLKENRISVPPNLSIIATINTSDESIYYLDTAFKRRWDWEYVKAPLMDSSSYTPEKLQQVKLIINEETQKFWSNYIIGINEFIKSHYQTIRRIEDKQIGWWFIKPENDRIELQQVKDKLMFYLWDSVFSRDKKPLEKILSSEKVPVKLTQYSDFVDMTEEFIEKMYEIYDYKRYPF